MVTVVDCMITMFVPISPLHWYYLGPSPGLTTCTGILVSGATSGETQVKTLVRSLMSSLCPGAIKRQGHHGAYKAIEEAAEESGVKRDEYRGNSWGQEEEGERGNLFWP